MTLNESYEALYTAVKKFFETRCTCADEEIEDHCPQAEAEDELRKIFLATGMSSSFHDKLHCPTCQEPHP